MSAQGGKEDLTSRTRRFALAVIRLYSPLPKTTEWQVIGKQLLRAGTSVGAHYREATRARSTAEFISKVDGGRQELEETMYWLELLREGAGTVGKGGETKAEAGIASKIAPLYGEADELMAILTTCARNAKNRGNKQ